MFVMTKPMYPICVPLPIDSRIETLYETFRKNVQLRRNMFSLKTKKKIEFSFSIEDKSVKKKIIG